MNELTKDMEQYFEADGSPKTLKHQQPAAPSLQECPKCGMWHGGEEDACFRCFSNKIEAEFTICNKCGHGKYLNVSHVCWK